MERTRSLNSGCAECSTREGRSRPLSDSLCVHDFFVALETFDRVEERCRGVSMAVNVNQSFVGASSAASSIMDLVTWLWKNFGVQSQVSDDGQTFFAGSRSCDYCDHSVDYT